MTSEANVEFIRQWVAEGWNGGNFRLVDQKYSPNYTLHDPSLPEQKIVGREAFKGFVNAFRTGMPDIKFVIEDVVADGDKVAWRFTVSGTQTAELMGFPPSGNFGTSTGIVFSRFENGTWLEDYVNWDTLGFLQNIGVIPRMG